MKKTKIIITKSLFMEGVEIFIEKNEKILNELLAEGYEIKSSNYEIGNNYRHLYTLLEKEVD